MDKKFFDIEEFDKKSNSDFREYMDSNDTKFRQSKINAEGGFYLEIETPPNPKLYQIYREYYLNGSIRVVGVDLRGLPVGVWKIYDELGRLKEEIDYDQQYGKFDYNQVILFIEKKGHIDIKTGKGRDDLAFAYNEDDNLWDVTIWPSANNQRLGYFYYIDVNSGKVKKSGRVQPGG